MTPSVVNSKLSFTEKEIKLIVVSNLLSTLLNTIQLYKLNLIKKYLDLTKKFSLQ